MIRRFVCSRQAHGHAAHLPDHFSRDLQRGGAPVDAENAPGEVRRALVWRTFASDASTRWPRPNLRAAGEARNQWRRWCAATTFPRHSSPPICASFLATASMALSGVVIRMTSESSTWRVSRRGISRADHAHGGASRGNGSPGDPPMRQPRPCNWRPSARPTRPAPTMDNVSDIRCVSITVWHLAGCGQFNFAHFLDCTIWSDRCLWIVQGIRAGIGMARLPWLSDAPPIASMDVPFRFHYLCRAG